MIVLLLLGVFPQVVLEHVIEREGGGGGGGGGERRNLVRTFFRWIQDARAWRCGLDFASFSGFRGLEFRMLRLIAVMIERVGGDVDMTVESF